MTLRKLSAKPKKTKVPTNGSRKRSKAGTAEPSAPRSRSARKVAATSTKAAEKLSRPAVTKISRPYLAPLGRSEIGLPRIRAAIRKAA